MIPGMWSLMEGTRYSQFYVNFRIAAGLEKGSHRGAPFNDGDLYKWLEGASASLAASPDPELERRLEEIIGVIAGAQNADGYLHTATLIRQRNGDTGARPFQDRFNFEMYNLGHLMTAACVHYRVTGKSSLLQTARRAADFLDRTFREASPEAARSSVCPSHYMGILELYRTTREPRYLELARRFFALRSRISDGGDDNQDRVPLEQQTAAVGHAVRANYLYAGATDLFMETGESALWEPLERIWENLVGRKMYITGGCGALYDGASPDGSRDQKSITRTHQAYGRDYQLPSLTAHSETCANIGNVLWNWRMFLATGEARFMDVVELSLYNSVLSGVSLGGTEFFYVNPLRNVDPLPTELRWPRTRVPFLSSFCCPPNLVRTVAEVSGYAYAKSEGAIWVNLFGSSTMRTVLAGGQAVKLTQETEYPWDGRIRIVVRECGEETFGLNLRIPGWTAAPSVRINGEPLRAAVAPATYVEVRRRWRPGDTVEVELPMPARLMESHPLVEETSNEVAIQRGPVVYCLESPDLPKGTRVPDVMIPESMRLTSRYEGGVLGGIVLLEGNVRARSPETWTGQLYREFRRQALRSVDVRFIPYYAWANRGPSEMTVWLPLHRGR
jgi:uncharacterized protein